MATRARYLCFLFVYIHEYTILQFEGLRFLSIRAIIIKTLYGKEIGTSNLMAMRVISDKSHELFTKLRNLPREAREI